MTVVAGKLVGEPFMLTRPPGTGPIDLQAHLVMIQTMVHAASLAKNEGREIGGVEALEAACRGWIFGSSRLDDDRVVDPDLRRFCRARLENARDVVLFNLLLQLVGQPFEEWREGRYVRITWILESGSPVEPTGPPKDMAAAMPKLLREQLDRYELWRERIDDLLARIDHDVPRRPRMGNRGRKPG
jgi:hypothetical protein